MFSTSFRGCVLSKPALNTSVFILLLQKVTVSTSSFRLYIRSNYVYHRDNKRIDTCYRRQIKFFSFGTVVAAIGQIILGIVGVTLYRNYNSSDVICDQENNTWTWSNSDGNLFVTFHIVFVLGKAGLTAIIFSVLPDRGGLWKTKEQLEEEREKRR